MLCYVMLCYVMLCLCYVMLCYVLLCSVMLCYVMLCYVKLTVRWTDAQIIPNEKRHNLLSFFWVSLTGSASDGCALQEALYKCIDTMQCISNLFFTTGKMRVERRNHSLDRSQFHTNSPLLTNNCLRFSRHLIQRLLQ